MSGQRGRERMEIIMPENEIPSNKRKKRSSVEQRMWKITFLARYFDIKIDILLEKNLCSFYFESF